MKYYWYKTKRIPNLNFKWLRNKPDGTIYLGFDGKVTEHDIMRCNLIELGHLTKKQFERKHGSFMIGGRK